jgi:flagellum-specific peptidoglycan hydrolase FlgJ
MSRTIDSKFILAAQSAQRIYGVPSSVSLAQGILESGWFVHDLGVNNYFGIKFGGLVHCDGFVERNTKEWLHGRTILINAKFASFKTPEGAFLEHARFLSEHPELSRAMKFKDEPDKFVLALQDGVTKYATSLTYAKDLITIMKQNNLYQYDNLSADIPCPPTTDITSTN